MVLYGVPWVLAIVYCHSYPVRDVCMECHGVYVSPFVDWATGVAGLTNEGLVLLLSYLSLVGRRPGRWLHVRVAGWLDARAVSSGVGL